MCHPVRTPICLLFHSFGRRVILSGHQTDKHHLSRRRASSVRKPTSYLESTSNVRTSPPHCPDVRASDMEIACWSLAVRTLLPDNPDARSLLWKLLSADVRPSGRSSHPVQTMFLYRKDFSAKILENPVAQLSVRTTMVHRPDSPQAYFS
jgi:hypothetical protein